MKIIVVDNASTDRSVEKIRSRVDCVLTLERNFGFGEAVNRGANLIDALPRDFIFILNQDAEIFPDTVEKLVAVAQRDCEYGILSGVHWADESRRLEVKFGRHLRRRQPLLYFRLKRNRPIGHSVVPVHFINAAAWLVRRDCWDKVGGFNPDYFMYEEDVEFSDRAKALGYLVGLVPEAAVLHFRYRPESSPFEVPYSQCRNSLRRTLRTRTGLAKWWGVIGWFCFRSVLCVWPGETVRFRDLWRALKDAL